MKGQLTIRGVVIGVIGCIIITAASIYTALKMGALPWPIIFAALISLFFLRVMGSRSLNEANVTHTIMSAGAMVAGGLAFTIPGIWILGLGETDFTQMLIIALAGTLLGLVASAYLRRLFIDEQELEFPIGRAAAETLIAGDKGGKVGVKLFTSMGLAGLWAVLRDMLHAVPAMVLNGLPLAGVTFGIYLSPMMVSVGFLVGTVAMVAWFGGALWQLVFVAGGSAAGLFDVAVAQAINSSLGMGVMMGCGIAVVCKDVLPRGFQALRGRSSNEVNGGRLRGLLRRPASSSSIDSAVATPQVEGAAGSLERRDDAELDSAAGSLERRNDAGLDSAAGSSRSRVFAGLLALLAAGLAYVGCVLVGIGPLASVLVIAFAFVTVAMSAQSVGQTGIDPMEIFGLIVLLIVAFIGDTPQLQLFFVAGIIAVACGLGGDVMNDFKAGAVLGTSSKAQVAGQAIGGVIGAIVAAVSLYALVGAYGPDAFGLGKDFVAAQASVVATLVAGVPSMPGFLVGLALGFAIYCLRGPAMMIGLGIYLPFYMSLTAFLGCLLKWIVDAIVRRRAVSSAASSTTAAPASASASEAAASPAAAGSSTAAPASASASEAAASPAAAGSSTATPNLRDASSMGKEPLIQSRADSEDSSDSSDSDLQEAANQDGIIIASGVLGGESIVGVILAIMAVASGI